MTAKEFEAELKELNTEFSVVDNPNRPGLTNIFFKGKNYDLPVISTHLIKDEIDPSHRYEFPNGMTARHHSKQEVLDRLTKFLKDYQSGDYAEYED